MKKWHRMEVVILKPFNGDGENASMNTFNAFNASQNNIANIVGQQLLLNMLKFSK